mgnify:CR=1 FL=1
MVLKRKIFNSQYLLLLHTYVLANAFWVMLIRASYSNRFAYLSWFMYPVVLAYPLLTLRFGRSREKGWNDIGGAYIIYLLNVDQRMIGKKMLTVFTPAYNRAHTIGRTYEVYVDRLVRILSGWL